MLKSAGHFAPRDLGGATHVYISSACQLRESC